MKELVTIDVGHLINDAGSSHFISTSEFEALSSKYGAAFDSFLSPLREMSSPMTLSLHEREKIPYIKELAALLKDKFENILLIGIGGSSLGPQAMMQFLKGPFYNVEQHTRPRFFVADNIDPLLVHHLEKVLDFSKTGIVYISKSGSTPESAANFIHFYGRYKEAGGSPQDIVIICDQADNGINRIAKELNCHLLHIPSKLGGRYSVLSSVGFLPAELMDIDSLELLNGAAQVHQALVNVELADNAVFALGACLHELSMRGKNLHVMFNYSSMLTEFGQWFMQLWAESLGKLHSLSGEVVHSGTTPLACTGAIDQHSVLQMFKEGPADKVYGFIKIENMMVDTVLTDQFSSEKEYAYFKGHTVKEQLHLEQLTTEMSLYKAERPCYRVSVRDVSPAAIGGLFYLYEALTVWTAELMKIDPYDQPGVEEGKNMTYSLMGRSDHAARKPEYEQAARDYMAKSRVYKIG
ncbi:MAG: glucose-6-phosphate isomerase [Acidobacteriota bacterium]